jgi:hypothetical protein
MDPTNRPHLVGHTQALEPAWTPPPTAHGSAPAPSGLFAQPIELLAVLDRERTGTVESLVAKSRPPVRVTLATLVDLAHVTRLD